MKKRGRKSADELAIVGVAGSVEPFAPAPADLDPAAASLWRQIVASRPAGFFGPGDFPLLREYCLTTATMLPKVNAIVAEEFDPKTLDARDKLVRLAASLAGKLRLCVSSRTRPDTASMRDANQPRRPLWE